MAGKEGHNNSEKTLTVHVGKRSAHQSAKEGIGGSQSRGQGTLLNIHTHPPDLPGQDSCHKRCKCSRSAELGRMHIRRLQECVCGNAMKSNAVISA